MATIFSSTLLRLSVCLFVDNCTLSEYAQACKSHESDSDERSSDHRSLAGCVLFLNGRPQIRRHSSCLVLVRVPNDRASWMAAAAP